MVVSHLATFYQPNIMLFLGNNTTCHPTCDENGCWGPGPSDCLNCRDKIYNGTCYEECRNDMGVYEEEGSMFILIFSSRNTKSTKRLHVACCRAVGPAFDFKSGQTTDLKWVFTASLLNFQRITSAQSYSLCY